MVATGQSLPRASFKLLKANQLRLVAVLDNRMDSLKVVQNQTFTKIDQIDRQFAALG